MMQRKRLGEIFVSQGIITEKTVERVLAISRTLGRRFGTILEEMSLITGEELAQALAIQYGCRVVTGLADHSYAPELLGLVPGEVAMNNLIFPIKREGNRLAIAMADPTETRVVSNIAVDNRLEIVPVVSPRIDIFAAICRHYLGREPKPSQDRTVLVVDDDLLERRVITDVLTKQGYNVVTAADGMEGFKAVISEKPHVVITDKEMPKLDGYGLFDALQRVSETMFIPVILITGTANAAEEETAFARGFNDFILKPVRDITLITRVKRAFYFYDHHYRVNGI